MSANTQIELQKALYVALNSDGTLGAIITGVFDFVPQNTSFPYITVSDMTALDWSGAQFDGMEMTVTIHSWSQAEGSKQVKSIMNEIYRILHNQSLTVVGHEFVNMRFEFSNVLRDPDGFTQHGVQRFRIILTAV